MELKDLLPRRLPSLTLSHILVYSRRLHLLVSKKMKPTLKLQDIMFIIYETFNLMMSPDSIPKPRICDKIDCEQCHFQLKINETTS